MLRRNKPKQLSGQDLERFLQAAEHLSIVGSLISPQCNRYRSTQIANVPWLGLRSEWVGDLSTIVRRNRP